MPVDPPRMIDGDPAAAGETGLAVMTTVADDAGRAGVAMGRLVEGQYLWREQFDVERARQIGRGMLDAALRAELGRKVTDGPTTGEVHAVATAIRALVTGGLPHLDDLTVMRIAAAAITLGASPAFARGDWTVDREDWRTIGG